LNNPTYVVPEKSLIPVSDHLTRMQPILTSQTYLISKMMAAYREKNPESPCYNASQGDGGASLPGVPRDILERATQMQIERGTAYEPPAGTPAFRNAVIEQYWQVDSALGIGPKNVLAAVGGRDALVKAFEAMLALGHGRQGDILIVSRVPWISYNWGPYSVGANVLLAPGEQESAWAYSPEGIRQCVDYAARSGRKVAGIVITNPDNPTGRTISVEEQAKLGHAALEAGIAFVLYDWIYHYITDESPTDINALLRLFEPGERKRLMFMDGLTKSLGASNIRNAHLIASEAAIDFIAARASHNVIPDFYSQAVAMAAFEMGFAKAARTIIEPTNTSRRWLKDYLDQHDFTYIMGKGYYAFIHVSKWLTARGWKDSEPLGFYLAEKHGLAIVPGVYFSAYGGEWVRFSYATPPEITRGAAERLVRGLESLVDLQ
jgi:aspartate/methionine/tyrosine aminotransferase